jgi:hypothetical protein
MQSSRAAADELLLDIYSRMNEPDGIYAVARGHSMVSQLKLYEHESSWDKALTGYDLLCRRAPPASTPPAPPLPQPGQDTAVSGGSSPHWQQGLLTALQQLGCRHLIEAYWQGQPASLSPGELLLASLRPLTSRGPHLFLQIAFQTRILSFSAGLLVQVLRHNCLCRAISEQ